MKQFKRAVAFVLGLGVNSYGIVRSLAHNRIPVAGIYDNEMELGRYSNLVNAQARATPP